jgi:hypothetical protein
MTVQFLMTLIKETRNRITYNKKMTIMMKMTKILKRQRRRRRKRERRKTRTKEDKVSDHQCQIK